jgi:hypothetical protein
MIKVLYKPLSLLASVLGGMLAGVILTGFWPGENGDYKKAA